MMRLEMDRTQASQMLYHLSVLLALQFLQPGKKGDFRATFSLRNSVQPMSLVSRRTLAQGSPDMFTVSKG